MNLSQKNRIKILAYSKHFYNFYFFLFFKKINFIFQLYFFNKKNDYFYYHNHLKNLKNFSLSKNIKFRWFKFVLFSGLGFKKKISKLKNFLYLYIGDRHWLVLKIPKNIFIFPFKKRNLIFFSNSKISLFYFNNLLKELKKESVFKVKGFLDVRTKRRWLFVRRLKIKGLKTKLSKKQKLI